MLQISKRDQSILDTIYPPFADMAEKHLQICHELSLPVHLTVGARTPKEQDKAKELGYSGLGAWESYHQYFVAYDVCFDNEDAPGIQDPYLEPFIGAWKQVADIAESIGIRAGFYFRKKDKPHYEARVESPIKELQSILFSGGRLALWNHYEKIELQAFKMKPSKEVL